MAFKDEEERRAYFRDYNKGWNKKLVNVTSYVAIAMRNFTGRKRT